MYSLFLSRVVHEKLPVTNLLFCTFSNQLIVIVPFRVSGKDVADQQQQQQSAAVIVIDDDEAEFVDVSDMSCQATFEDIENETRDKDKEEMPNTSQNNNLSVQRDILQNYVPIRPAPVKESTHTCNSGTLQTATSSVHLQTISKQPDVVSSVTSAGKTPPVIYRTLKSPVVSGVSFVPQRVALKSSPPSLPVQQAMSSLKSSTATASSLVSPGDNRYMYVFVWKEMMVHVAWYKCRNTMRTIQL